VTSVIANVLWSIGASALTGSVLAGVMGRKRECWLLVVAGLTLLAVECALERSWPGVAWNAAWVAVLLGRDWWNRGGRKAAKVLGAKAKAARDAIVRRTREAGAPLPEGAKA
jgi:hypothetical protein